MVVSEDAIVTDGAMIRSGRSIDFACATEFLSNANSIEKDESGNEESSGGINGIGIHASSEGSRFVFRDDAGIRETGEKH
jgi:hypothetical protein